MYGAASLLLAIAAGAALHAWATGAAAASAAGGPPTPVVVAGSDVPRGATLRTDQLRIARIPASFVPPGAYAQVSQAAGRVALAGLSAGEVVTRTRLARVRAGPVASLTPQGLRAFAVPTSLPPGAVAAGDHVDVVATFGPGSGQPHSESVVSAAEVLLVLGPPGTGSGSGGGLPSGAGLDAAASGAGASLTLVLLVSPDEEERLAFASAFADLAVAVAPAGEPDAEPGGALGQEGVSNQPDPTATTPPPTDTRMESPSG
jgi:Flp pilus assembly protein CpaB